MIGEGKPNFKVFLSKETVLLVNIDNIRLFLLKALQVFPEPGLTTKLRTLPSITHIPESETIVSFTFPVVTAPTGNVSLNPLTTSLPIETKSTYICQKFLDSSIDIKLLK